MRIKWLFPFFYTPNPPLSWTLPQATKQNLLKLNKPDLELTAKNGLNDQHNSKYEIFWPLINSKLPRFY